MFPKKAFPAEKGFAQGALFSVPLTGCLVLPKPSGNSNFPYSQALSEAWGSGKHFRGSKHPTWQCFGAGFWCQSSSLNDIHFELPISLLQANFHIPYTKIPKYTGDFQNIIPLGYKNVKKKPSSWPFCYKVQQTAYA